MRKVLIASHGRLAEGLADAAVFITGMKERIDYICCYVDDDDPGEILEKYFAGLTGADELIVVTDILGGSVTQKILPYTQKDNIYLIAGANLGLVLGILFLPERKLSDEDICELVSQSREGIQFMNECVLQVSEQDEV